MRRVCHTSCKQQAPLVLGVLAILIVAVAVFLFLLSLEPNYFDEAAVRGTPDVVDGEAHGYETFNAIGIGKAMLCGMPEIKGKDVYFYLTNPEDNTVAIRLEIYTPLMVQKSDGSYEPVPDKLLGESGFIRPGEYVERVQLDKRLAAPRTNVMIKIATLDEATGRSNGYFFVNTVLVQ